MIPSTLDKPDDLKNKNGALPETPTKANNLNHNSSQHFAIAKYSYETQQSDELSLTKGDKIVVLEKSSDGWWHCRLVNDSDKVGWIPSNYVIEEAGDSLGQPAKNGEKLNGNGESNGKQVISHEIAPPIQFQELVVALYSFKCENDEELSFEKGEQLEVIDKPTCDPDW